MIAGERPLLFWKRDMIWRQGGFIQTATYDPLRSTPLFSDYGRAVPDNMSNPLVRRAMQASPAIQGFLRWSIMPMATVERRPCEAIVTFGDARFGVPVARSRLARRVTLPLAGPLCGKTPVH